MGGIDPGYVLDRMQPYEIDACMEGLYVSNMEGWNQTRQIVYAIAQSNSRHRIDIKEMMPFPWDEPSENTMSDEERNRLSSLMKEFIKEKNDGGRSICKDIVQKQ